MKRLFIQRFLISSLSLPIQKAMFLLAFCLSYDFVYAVFGCATCFALMLPNFFAKENYTAILYSIAHGVLFLKASMRFYCESKRSLV